MHASHIPPAPTPFTPPHMFNYAALQSETCLFSSASLFHVAALNSRSVTGQCTHPSNTLSIFEPPQLRTFIHNAFDFITACDFYFSFFFQMPSADLTSGVSIPCKSWREKSFSLNNGSHKNQPSCQVHGELAL